MQNVYVWIDFACINQDGDPAGELKQLDLIVNACDCILTPIVDPNHDEWELKDTWRGMLEAYQAPSWCKGEYAYLNRAVLYNTHFKLLFF